MELFQHGCLEEHLLQRRETWEAYFFGGAPGDFFSHESTGNCFDYCCFTDRGGGIGDYCSFLPNPELDALGVPADVGFGCPNPATYCSPPLPAPLEATAFGNVAPLSPREVVGKLEELNQPCVEAGGRSKANTPALPLSAFHVGSLSLSCTTPERKLIRSKKVKGQPSKNLLAERRRRKRLNDRLSMLRSVVPKISKMDRTSILGDTIDYMKELLDRIKRLQEEMDPGDGSSSSSASEDTPPWDVLGVFRHLLDPNGALLKNSNPKFDVERREVDTRVEICCAANAGLLLSILSTLEALGLDIQQCVISCFGEFGMQASCSEDVKQRAVVSSEEMKQALFRNAGYGGRCV